jgi:N-acetylglutamate synthase-like GNAT family acetyltransferase
MIQSLPVTPPIGACHLRPATQPDAKQLRALTRQLHRSAIAQPKWQEWLVWAMISFTSLFVWQYPAMAVAIVISSAPLWLVIVFSLCLATHEQEQQCERYWVVEYQGQLVGCGRLDRHPQHAEIYDLFVRPEWRSSGLGRAIMAQLIAQSPQPIYLASLPKATPFYQKLGFVPIAPSQLPRLLSGRLSLNSPRYRQVGLQPMVLQPVSGKVLSRIPVDRENLFD